MPQLPPPPRFRGPCHQKMCKRAFNVTQSQCPRPTPSVDLFDYLQKIFNVILRSQKVKYFPSLSRRARSSRRLLLPLKQPFVYNYNLYH
jgi:hypothetical protein